MNGIRGGPAGPRRPRGTPPRRAPRGAKTFAAGSGALVLESGYPMKLSAKAAAALGGAAVFLLLVMGTSFWAFREIRAAAAARKHTFEVMALADDLLSAMKDAETGQRGYSLTGDETFLKPYLAVKDGLKRDLESLRRLTAIPEAQRNLQTVAPLMSAKLSEMERGIERRRGLGPPSVVASAGEVQGMRLMDSIREEMRGYARTQEAALARNEHKLQANMRFLFGVIVAASLTMLLLALAVAYLIHRESQHQLRKIVLVDTQHVLDLREESNTKLSQINAALRFSEEKLAVTLMSIGDAVIATDVEGRVTLLNPVAERLTGWTQAEAANAPVEGIFNLVNRETRLPSPIPLKEALAEGTMQRLEDHAILIARDGSERAVDDSCAPMRDRDGRVMGAVMVFRDVDREYAAQQALRDSTAVIQAILDTVAEGIVTVHAATGLLETVNPAAERMFGYGPGELASQHVSVAIPSFDRARREGLQARAGALDETASIVLEPELSGRRKDGSAFPLEVTLREMSLGGDRYFTGSLRDLTAKKRAKEALREAGALQAAIFNSANFSSIATDEKGVIQIFNVGAERMLGYAAADVMNKVTPADISDPQELIARARSLSAEVLAPVAPGFEALVFKASRGIEDIYELTYVRKDGSRFPAVVSVTALRDSRDRIIGYLLIGTDNTARRRVEEEQKLLGRRLRDSQFYTRSLFESNVDALMTTDPTGVITDVNKQMEALTACTRDELLGSQFGRHFTDPEMAEAAIQLVLSAKMISNYELTALDRSGRQTEVSVNATTFYDRERTLQGVFAAARDITERKHLDRVLQEKNVELERARLVAETASMAKSEFLSSMSHELRSPLNAILGFAQLIESDVPPPNLAHKESVSQILRAGWHLLTLIDQILDLAKVESGQARLSREPVGLAEVILECRDMVTPQAQQHDVTLVVEESPARYWVSVDRTRAKQVLLNLLSNAIKYNTRGGMVKVSCAQSGPDRIRVSIRDTGAGLHPGEIAQLFQAFNRLGQEAGAEEGTGIGLVVAKRLVQLMGGAIGVESTGGEGTTFWVDLVAVAAPRLAAEAETGPEQESARASRGAREHTILYVEDNPANLKLMEQIIARHADIRLLTAMNGNSGIELARAALPDVILMDINLPGISGFEALKILRADPATSRIPVVAVSANAMALDRERGMKAGFFSYMTKPIRVKEFMEVLDTALAFAGEMAGRKA